MEYGSYKRIPNTLRAHWEAVGLSQKKVVEILGLKDNTLISRWENGNSLPNLVSAIRLSIIYKISVNELYTSLVRIVQTEKKRDSTTG
jgi:transcriptional regulator with XRE-family HTH domain